ncbi:hypothetical protein P1P75_29520 [Streptomyces sp. ID05-39B]|uniref:hypothetical protein n=1 Tax=Streptomyces sp. ID05-39B TaxID=3028664 RepID=UPI0029B12C1C|nr:hypothetical protein [Streptomyces sp. ID05-39B]MDX3530437.1 hypothetical protein [Streptomyces sp. ID05-39B]
MSLAAALVTTVTALALAFASAEAVAAVGSGEVALRLEAPSSFVMYNAEEGADASNSEFVVPVAVEAGDGGPARGVRVAVDASGLAGVARAVKGGYGNCTGGGPVFTCLYGDLQNGDGESNAPFTLHGVNGVEPGASGTVTYTASADNAPSVTGTTRMTVGGPALHGPGAHPGVSGLRTGEPGTVTPGFANNSRFPAAQGVALKVDVEGLALATRHSNCYYPGPLPSSAWCVFPTKAAAGAAYRTSAPLVYTALPQKLTGSLVYTWSSAPRKPDGHTVRGTGAPLTLVGTAGRGFESGDGTLGVTTTVQADYSPVTATVRGRVGDTVKVRLGVRDLGPGRILGDESLGRFEVVPPQGTTVTSIPYTFEDGGGKWACERPKTPGGSFVCEIGGDRFLEARHEGDTTSLDFHVRIDRRVPGARGTIRTYNPYDRTPGNDVAVIPLEASPALPYRPLREPGTWAAVGAGALAVGAAVTVYRRHRAAKGQCWATSIRADG